ncbi:unnamed protein product, partial [Phaeothamnion confervicola]
MGTIHLPVFRACTVSIALRFCPKNPRPGTENLNHEPFGNPTFSPSSLPNAPLKIPSFLFLQVIDTLRTDYPTLFYEPLDFGIYTKDIEIRDPTGVAFRGINTYRRLFAVLRFFRQVLLESAQTSFKLTYDWQHQAVRVTWHVVAAMKSQRQRPLYLDGVSVYSLTDDGLVKSHVFETIIVNGTPVEPPFAYAWINLDSWLGAETPTMVPGGVASSLLAAPAKIAAAAAAVPPAAAAAPVQMAATALLTPVQVAAAAALATPVRMAAAAPRNEGGRSQRSSSSGNKNSARSKQDKGWPKVDLPNSCESSWDCDSPQTCCDFVLFKVCCSQGGLGTP